MADADPPARTISLGTGVAAVEAAAWDALAGGANPFVGHAFLSLLEESGSVGPRTGWQPAPLLVDDGAGALVAAAPAYLKTHSQGEYVFDHGWADAWARAGGAYYPKLQIAVPFTPVPGPRLLAAGDEDARLLIRAAEAVVRQNELSSAHATFVAPEQMPLFEAAGWLVRRDVQFHFANPGYRSFDDFLATLTSAKRKQLRKERARAVVGLRIEQVTGDAIGPAHWDAMWAFYQDTGGRKWGHPYLTRAAFDLIGARMADRVLLIVAYDGDTPVAGAMHLIGADTLYGRYWGCVADIPYLHFELCYYRAIDVAIERGLARVEAGAQGGHKLARGYGPVATWSAHFIADPGFRRAVADFLERERAAEMQEMEWLEGHMPFRRAD
ncbi:MULTISPECIES: GNAT family N-acetyltransferase [Sphingopyxis]|jgi:predicted N-acyltransferase|uniref:GNAT family N-acetyltransferase n=1 Tax=Sphingopyxis TaxID=165697 RepID=UPI00086F7F92|nr:MULTISPECIES: GNAT family N-acetyltransferase [Sphingopyxis]APW71586.1 GNAT family N-acetyltransferase [Sphingopyxis granuli]AVA15535.1 N-acetyltransferase [Sphingopyxis sp. MG]ODU28143.1 MAG: GNAT family N-acetyltransferase [Sphingopyxis sp. SCN 67-31]